MKKRVVLSLSPLHAQYPHRGIGAYTRSLFQALQALNPPDIQLSLATGTPGEPTDLIHYPYFDFFFLTLPWPQKVPTIVTVHDVIPLLYPEHYPAGIKGTIRFQLQKLKLQSVQAVLTDSRTSARDIGRYLGVPAAKTHPIYLAADAGFAPQSKEAVNRVKQKYGLTGDYYLYVGDINFSKNLSALLRAWATVPAKQLILVSRALAGESPEAAQMRQLIKELDLVSKVTILTTLPTDTTADLAALYSGCDWYIQPSLYEGFGLPVIEAMACGAAVISSTGGSLQEVAGDAAITFDPAAKNGLTVALKQAEAMPSTEKQALRQKSRQWAATFSWQKTAEETLDVYRRVLG